MVNLGHNFAKVWLTDEIDMDLVHPTDGSAYSISLKAQQRIDKYTKGQLPKLMCIGHYHKSNIIYHNGVYGLICPSFQGQSSFFDGRNLESLIGGVIFTIRVDAMGGILSIAPEFVMYDEIREDY